MNDARSRQTHQKHVKTRKNVSWSLDANSFLKSEEREFGYDSTRLTWVATRVKTCEVIAVESLESSILSMSRTTWTSSTVSWFSVNFASRKRFRLLASPFCVAERFVGKFTSLQCSHCRVENAFWNYYQRISFFVVFCICVKICRNEASIRDMGKNPNTIFTWKLRLAGVTVNATKISTLWRISSDNCCAVEATNSTQIPWNFPQDLFGDREKFAGRKRERENGEPQITLSNLLSEYWS